MLKHIDMIDSPAVGNEYCTRTKESEVRKRIIDLPTSEDKGSSGDIISTLKFHRGFDKVDVKELLVPGKNR